MWRRSSAAPRMASRSSGVSAWASVSLGLRSRTVRRVPPAACVFSVQFLCAHFSCAGAAGRPATQNKSRNRAHLAWNRIVSYNCPSAENTDHRSDADFREKRPQVGCTLGYRGLRRSEPASLASLNSLLPATAASECRDPSARTERGPQDDKQRMTGLRMTSRRRTRTCFPPAHHPTNALHVR
jgi:hypothetical protein